MPHSSDRTLNALPRVFIRRKGRSVDHQVEMNRGAEWKLCLVAANQSILDRAFCKPSCRSQARTVNFPHMKTEYPASGV